MKQFVESLKRLYVKGDIGTDKVQNLFELGKITTEERDYILNTN